LGRRVGIEDGVGVGAGAGRGVEGCAGGGSEGVDVGGVETGSVSVEGADVLGTRTGGVWMEGAALIRGLEVDALGILVDEVNSFMVLVGCVMLCLGG
jgi:hypothetical protein